MTIKDLAIRAPRLFCSTGCLVDAPSRLSERQKIANSHRVSWMPFSNSMTNFVVCPIASNLGNGMQVVSFAASAQPGRRLPKNPDSQ